MSRYALARGLFILMAGLVLAGCGIRQPGMVTPQPTAAAPVPSQTAPVRVSQVPATTVAPAAATATPVLGLATAIPLSAMPAASFSLGVPAGDAYDPAGMAVDAAGSRAYIYARAPGAGGPVIAVVDLAGGEVLRLIPLLTKGISSPENVLLSPDGEQGYAVDRDAAVLTLFDPHTGALGATVDGVTEAALSPASQVSSASDESAGRPPARLTAAARGWGGSPDGKLLYAIMGREGLRAFATTDLKAGRAAELWRVSDAPYVELAVNGDVLAATRGGAQPALVTFDGATGRQLGSTPLDDAIGSLAPGPDGGWLISTGYNPRRLVRLDSGLRVVAEAEALSGSDPYYDAPRGRYLIAGWPTGGTPLRDQQEIVSYADDDLTPTTLVKGARDDLPDIFAPYGDDMLLGLRRHDGARLSLLDPGDLSSTRDVILGVKLVDMALDVAANTLYVADDQDRIHVLGVPDGDVRATWPGSAPIALDAANGRLYANRAGRVVALETRTGEEVARFPQGGMPAPDPNRDLVYITDSGVTIYDRAGTQIGRLDDTFPAEPGTYPNPFAFAARVNPADGTLVTIFNNGTPGSNNRSFLRLYPLQADRPITVTGPFTFVSDLAFDPGGDLLVSYSNALNMEALQRLDSAGHERSRLGGRTGKLALDPTTGLLYVADAGALARVPVLPEAHGPGDAETMQLADLYRGPTRASQILLHPGLRQLYVRNEDSSEITVLNLDGLEPIDMHPVAVDGLPSDADISALNFLDASGAGKVAVYATTVTGEHYRAEIVPGTSGSDLHWQRLPVGSLPAWGQLTVAGDVLFRAGSGEYGGDGVFRSRDGGDSWDLLAAGLTDLRPAQAVLARSGDEAYFVGRTGGVFAWRSGAGGAQGKWERILPAERDYESLGDLSLAPDGTLFLVSWNRVRRSTDGGRSWNDLPLPGDGVKIAGFDPDYARTRTLFSHLCSSEQCMLLRSRDGGGTYESVLALPPYSYPLTLLAQAGRQELYLYASGYPAPQLYRSTDGGDSWQAADPGAVQGTSSAALSPDGQLWFGGKGSVRGTNPAKLSWSAVSPSPPLPSSSAPSPTACVQGLPDLGCPVSPESAVSMARQPFEHGRMIWIDSGPGLGDWEKVVVVLNGAGMEGAAWQRFPDLWQEGQPESDPALIPPEGLYQPIRGFGKIWREQLGGPQTSIGWATAPEEGISGHVQVYQGGIVLRLGDEQLMLADSGTWRVTQ